MKPLKSSLLDNLKKKQLERAHIFCIVYVSDYSTRSKFYNSSLLNVLTTKLEFGIQTSFNGNYNILNTQQVFHWSIMSA